MVAPRWEGAPQGAAAGRTQVRRPQNAAGTGQSETGARRPMQQENTPNTRTVYPQKAANAPSGRQEISGAPRQSTSGPERRPAPRPETNRAPQPERTAQPDRSGRTQVRRPQQGQPQHYAAERTQIQTPRPQPVRQPAPPENTGYVAAQPDMPAYSSVNNDAERYPYPDNAAYPAYSEETDTVQERALQPRNRNGAPHPDSAELRASDEEKRISLETLDSGETAEGILEIMPDGFGFIRGENYLPGDNDVYVAPSQIRRFNMKTGDIVSGTKRIRTGSEKFAALLFVNAINGRPPEETATRPAFEDLTPIYPDSRLHLETPGGTIAMRIVDLLCPIGKGQRGMIVSPPKAGKTTILKQVAQSMKINHPSMYLIVLLIDERPEEVTDIKESLAGPNVEVIYSTFDELPEHHKRVSEMVLERAKRLVEQGHDVMILLDSITRLARAYNLTVSPSGRTLTGGLDPAALHMPKRFFGAARNTREGGSLTILATALVDTGSRMDDVVYEEFKGTGNMELVLDRKLSERRIFPAVDILKSGTRRDELLLTQEELDAAMIVHRATNGMKGEEAVERILDMFARTRTNRDFIAIVRKTRFN